MAQRLLRWQAGAAGICSGTWEGDWLQRLLPYHTARGHLRVSQYSRFEVEPQNNSMQFNRASLPSGAPLMFYDLLLASFLQVIPLPAPPPDPPAPAQQSCVLRNSVLNAEVVQTCLRGLQSTGYGRTFSTRSAGTTAWVHEIPFRAETRLTLRTTICGLDLIDFTFRSGAGAVLDVGSQEESDRHCIMRTFIIPPGALAFVFRTTTEAPTLVIRSALVAPPAAALVSVDPPVVVYVPPPPVIAPPILLIPPIILPTPH